jgi:SulP family sulfate permease
VPYDPALAVDRDVLVYRITGAFFFGAASAIGSVLDGIADKRKGFVVDFAAVPFLDSTAANVLGRVAEKPIARASGCSSPGRRPLCAARY